MSKRTRLPVEIARDLRQTETPVEAILWDRLRNRQLAGAKFRRQHRIPNTVYVADFFCNESRLIIELDGPIHDQQEAADTLRQENLESLGYVVLRFRNEQITTDLTGVVQMIEKHLLEK